LEGLSRLVKNKPKKLNFTLLQKLDIISLEAVPNLRQKKHQIHITKRDIKNIFFKGASSIP